MLMELERALKVLPQLFSEGLSDCKVKWLVTSFLRLGGPDFI